MNMQLAKTLGQRALLLRRNSDRAETPPDGAAPHGKAVQTDYRLTGALSRPRNLCANIRPQRVMLRRSLIVLLHAGRQAAL